MGSLRSMKRKSRFRDIPSVESQQMFLDALLRFVSGLEERHGIKFETKFFDDYCTISGGEYLFWVGMDDGRITEHMGENGEDDTVWRDYGEIWEY